MNWKDQLMNENTNEKISGQITFDEYLNEWMMQTMIEKKCSINNEKINELLECKVALRSIEHLRKFHSKVIRNWRSSVKYHLNSLQKKFHSNFLPNETFFILMK